MALHHSGALAVLTVGWCMSFSHVISFGWAGLGFCLVLWGAMPVVAQPVGAGPRSFAPGSVRQARDLPMGRFRRDLERLSPHARQRSIEWLAQFRFSERDLDSLRIDTEGGVYYADSFNLEVSDQTAVLQTETASGTTVPVAPFPSALAFHSKPGSPNIIYLNFTGESVSGTAWNTSEKRDPIPATAFSADSDFSTFNDAEQLTMRRVWQRIAEDYAPFDVDVTTERPSSFDRRTAHVLITRSTDLNGDANPSSSGGGVAYVAVFGKSNFYRYRPTWIYYDHLANDDSYIAEAASHEVGHNMGLSHDGLSEGSSYYGGHGSGEVSWSPIMGTGYNRDVTQWSQGEYYNSDNSQDDLAVISGKVTYRQDDHGDANEVATRLIIEDEISITSSTPETDPGNQQPGNKGVIEFETDVDVFSFETESGLVSLTVEPWISPSGRTRGGNLDVRIELYDASGSLVASDSPASQTSANLQVMLAQGTYFLHVSNVGTGDPVSSPPSGYTAYGSLGQYFITGTLTPHTSTIPAVALEVDVNNPDWGTVTPESGSYPTNEAVTLSAQPGEHFAFSHWSGDVQGTNNPTSLMLTTTMNAQANFAELVTTNHPTPLWWLVSHGFTKDVEGAVDLMGLNGLPIWQSYVAGLDPNDPGSQLRAGIEHSGNGAGCVVRWNAVPGRAYTLLQSSSPTGPFLPVPGASALPATTDGITIPPGPVGFPVFFKVEVRLP